MKWLKVIGEATALTSMIILLILFGILTYNGISGGEYRVIIDSNIFYEHYLELTLLVIGFICYLKYGNVKVKKRTKEV